MTVEHILSLFFFYLHIGFGAFGGWRSYYDRRPGNHAEWRAESPGQPRKANRVLATVLHVPLLLFLVGVDMQSLLSVWGYRGKH